MGAGSRIVDFDEAAELGLPIVGYLAYDHAARLEPTVPLPEDGRGFPESRLVVCETLVRFDHGAGIAEVLAGDRGGDRRAARGGHPLAPRAARHRRRRSAARPTARATSRWSRT